MKKYIQQNKRVVITLAAVPVIVIIGFLFGLLYTGSTKEIVAVADQFQPDPSWKLESETITPPRIICIDSVCPQVFRSWSLKSDSSSIDDIKSKLRVFGNNISSEYSCNSEVKLVGAGSSCHLFGNASKFKYSLYILPDGDRAKINMSIE